MSAVNLIESEEEFKEFLSGRMTEFRNKNGLNVSAFTTTNEIKTVAKEPDPTEESREIVSMAAESVLNKIQPDKEVSTREDQTRTEAIQEPQIKVGVIDGVNKPSKQVENDQTDVAKTSIKIATHKPTKLKELKRSLGNGLSLYIKSEKLIYFLITINISSSKESRNIGTYPAMTFIAARKAADKYQILIKTSRRNEKDKNIKKLIKSPRNKEKNDVNMPCFRSLLDLGKFVQALKYKIENEKNTDVYLIIWLQLLIPTRTNELLIEGQSIFHHPPRDFWRVNPISSKKNTDVDCYEHISIVVKSALAKLMHQCNQISPGHLFADQKFCSVFQGDKKNQDQLISEGIKKVWPHYPISPDEFKSLFEYIAKKHSNFLPTFISNKVNNKGDSVYWIYNQPQTKALAEWWAEQLDRNEFHFDETQISMNGRI